MSSRLSRSSRNVPYGSTFDHMIYDANWDVVQDARLVKTLQGATAPTIIQPRWRPT
ncbi:MAG: hypothetical protein HOY79_31985 [Streptomyces sp.]|nr:hypothetical protein [Streptomyces sp.]